MRVEIEVCPTPGLSTTEQGRLLQNLARKALTPLQFRIVEEVRLTGAEVDLLCESVDSGEAVFVECKAWTQPLRSEALTKLLGNVDIHDASAGWMIATGPLGKDAKGVLEQWMKKPKEKRKKLTYFGPERLSKLLLDTGVVCSPETLAVGDLKRADVTHLVVSDLGYLWAVPIVSAFGGVPIAVSLFDARDGSPISDEKVISRLKETNYSLQDREFVTSGNPLSVVEQNTDVVVPIIPGDEWVDYRPARPQDFIGRVGAQRSTFELMEGIRIGSTETRLLAVKSPSGWGKSSVLLKIANRARNKRNRNRYFVFAADMRAATSRHYAEKALIKCFSEAVASSFIPSPEIPFTITSAHRPLDHESFRASLGQLRESRRLVVLFFDQFEEIFMKTSLASLFESILALAKAVEAAQENLALGFAWKTDGAVPQGHPAYFMWQGLSDRRREIDLPPFDRREISAALTRFGVELGEPLNPLLRKLLADQCQGYPWLLKKLCIHVFEQVRSGLQQDEALGQGLNIEALFREDINKLSPQEDKCLRHIARDTPADFFDIETIHGGTTIQSLIDQRLVIRRGSVLTLYWDIFRDYVLTNKVPIIPVTYIPQTGFARYHDGVSYLARQGSVTVEELAATLRVSQRAAENTVRDLVMLGNASKKRSELRLRQESLAEAEQAILEFCSRHVVYTELVAAFSREGKLDPRRVEALLRNLYRDSGFADSTWSIYSNRLISYLRGVGLLELKEGFLTPASEALRGVVRIPARRRGSRALMGFLAEAPPEKVLEAASLLSTRDRTDSFFNDRGLRNAVSTLRSLGIAKKWRGRYQLVTRGDELKEIDLARSASNASTLKWTAQLLLERGRVTPVEVGEMVGRALRREWSFSSRKRYGSALLRWTRWTARHLGDLATIADGAGVD